jgi:hypothetical protein
MVCTILSRTSSTRSFVIIISISTISTTYKDTNTLGYNQYQPFNMDDQTA